MIKHALPLVLLLAWPAVSHAEEDDERWLGPQGEDLSLRISADLSRFFRSGVTDFEVKASIGYFFTDWLAAGGSVGLGHTPDGGDATGSAQVAVRRQALTAGALRTVRHGWQGSTDLWLRFLPFALFRVLPEFLGPYANLEFGPRYAEGISPDLVLSVSIGLNLYPTERLALGPEVGYSFAFATDGDALFGDSRVDHVIAVTWGLTIYFAS